MDDHAIRIRHEMKKNRWISKETNEKMKKGQMN